MSRTAGRAASMPTTRPPTVVRADRRAGHPAVAIVDRIARVGQRPTTGRPARERPRRAPS